MKLLRIGAPGLERPATIDPQGRLRDLSAHVPDIADEALSDASVRRLAEIDPATLPLIDGTPRIGPCVGKKSRL